MRVLIDDVEYLPKYSTRTYIGDMSPGEPIYRGDILWDKRKEHWNIAVSHIEVRWATRVLIGQDGRTLKISNATRNKPS